MINGDWTRRKLSQGGLVLPNGAKALHRPPRQHGMGTMCDNNPSATVTLEMNVMSLFPMLSLMVTPH